MLYTHMLMLCWVKDFFLDAKLNKKHVWIKQVESHHDNVSNKFSSKTTHPQACLESPSSKEREWVRYISSHDPFSIDNISNQGEWVKILLVKLLLA